MIERLWRLWWFFACDKCECCGQHHPTVSWAYWRPLPAFICSPCDHGVHQDCPCSRKAA